MKRSLTHTLSLATSQQPHLLARFVVRSTSRGDLTKCYFGLKGDI